MGQGRVLVVEDDPIAARLMRVALSTEGYEVDVAPDGATAMQKAKETMPVAVLLDFVLPDGDGISLARAIREVDGGAGTQIILITGAFEGLHEIAPDRVDAFLPKPIDLDRLFELLDRLLGG